VDVALFVTCLTDTFAPRVGVALVRVLRHLGCVVHFPDQQTCCGQPAYNNGFFDQAAAMGRRLIDVLSDYPYVVSPSGSCVAMIRHHLPKLLADDPACAAAARELARRTFEPVGFLADVLRLDFASIECAERRPLTCHYSCHLRGVLSPEQAVRPLCSLRGVDYRPLNGLEQCCGFGGAFGALHPDISAAMTRDKLDAIAATGARVVVSNEAGCTLTLAGAARRQGLELEFKHFVELLAESLGLLAPAGDHAACQAELP